MKSNLTCLYCSKIYKGPIELPCKDSICSEHLHQTSVVKQNKIKCPKCKQEFKVKDNQFESNIFLQQLLDDKAYLNEEEKALKQKIEESIKVFYEMYDEFISSKAKLDFDCHEHFQEIRFQLDLHREKFKEKIDDIYMEMIEKTKQFEANYLKSLNENIEASLKSYEIKSTENDLNKLEQTFQDPNLLIETIREMCQKQTESLKTIHSIMDEVSQVEEFIKASNQFKENLSFSKDLFGQLNLGDPFKSQILIN